MRSLAFTLLGLFALVACDAGGNAPPPPPSDQEQLPGDGDDDQTDDPPGDTDPAPCTTVVARPGTVITTSGALTGVKTGTTWSWKGVRYAEPPVGTLRWQPPAPASCVATEVLATSFGPVCPQLSESTVIGNEDCLMLNVWAPEGAHDAPVLVYVHGGGNVVGSTSDPLYDGHELATRTGSVVVTIAYRLGALGYFSHPGLDDENARGVSGNYGILDQIAALTWVRDNIAGFGGSPANVLLFGESGGAQDTLVHVASPLSAGLFHAAIVESGGVYQDTIEDAQNEGQALVEAVGCAGATDVVACLRALPFATLTAVPAAVGPLGGSGLRYGPAIDGYVIPENPYAMFAAGTHNHVPFVIGTNADETSRMVPNVTTEEAYAAALRGYYGVAAGNALLTEYPASDYSSPRKALIAVTTDVIWTCPARRIARLISESQSPPVFRYHFTWKAPGAAGALYGSTHGLELPFVFRNFGAVAEDPDPQPADIALSEAMQRYWSRLPATGDVNGGSDVLWPNYDAADDPYLELDTTIVAKQGLATDHCDFIESLIAPR